MKQLSKFPNQELLTTQGPFVSIYQSVEMTAPNTEAEEIKFKNHLKDAKTRVKNECEGSVCDDLLAQLDRAPNNKSFWNLNRGGAVFFFTPEETYYYTVATPLPDQVAFGDRPLILPLIENFQYIENYYLLGLTNQDFKLYRGILDRIEPVELDEDAPDTLEKALGDELVRGSQLNSGGGSGSVHSMNEKSDELDIDQENYFRAVDKYVFENFNQPEQIPLILFSLTENQSVFRQLSKNTFLRDNRIELSPAQLNDADIQREAEKLIKRVLSELHSENINRYEETTPQYKLGDQHQDLATASLEGRIESLYVEKDTHKNGTIDDNGQVSEEGNENLLNQLALNVLRTNGKVYVLDRAQMPGLKDVAAILRY